MRGILVGLMAVILAGLSVGQAPKPEPRLDTARCDALRDAYFRKQVETITSQTKDFGAMARKTMADAVEPIKEQAARSFKLAV